MNLEQMSHNQLCELARQLQQALTDSNLALMEQTELAERCRQQAEAMEKAAITVQAGMPAVTVDTSFSIDRDAFWILIAKLKESRAGKEYHLARNSLVAYINGITAQAVAAALHDHDNAAALLHIDSEIEKNITELTKMVAGWEAAPQQHAQAALSDGLPPLPYPQWPSYGQNDECYSVEQTRAYGRLCIAASQQPAAAPADLEYKDVDSTDLWNEVARRVRADLAPAVSILAAAPAIQQEGRDWREDWHGGENQYECRCSTCGNPFFGHKRRITCKSCAIQQEGAALDERAEFLAYQRRTDAIPDYITDQLIMDGEITKHQWASWQARAALAAPAPVQPAQGDALRQAAKLEVVKALKGCMGILKNYGYDDAQAYADGKAALRAIKKQEPTA